jgi:HAD superfamily hydrolase (TIGR01457 family)
MTDSEREAQARAAAARLAEVRGFLLDMDGTLYLGERLLPGAPRLIETLQARGLRYLFLTNNSSKDSRQYADKLARLGLPATAGQVLTSGAATALYLQRERPGARVYVVGTPALEAEFAARGFKLTGADPEVAVLGFDTTLTYAKLWKLCDLVGAGLPYLATHPDLVCPTETGTMPDAGALIAAVRAATGRGPDVIVGKPNRLMVEMAAAQVGLPLARLAMVGDRLYTDMALGAAAGIPAILVLSGETRAADLAGAAQSPDLVLPDVGALADLLQSLPPAARHD